MPETTILELNILLAVLSNNLERAQELIALMTPSERTTLGIALATALTLVNEANPEAPSAERG